MAPLGTAPQPRVLSPPKQFGGREAKNFGFMGFRRAVHLKTALGLDEAEKSGLSVETAIALGATPRQATLQQVRRSPVIDNAKTVGLISLPGAMTGLIMGGASPLEAIQLQIVVKNMVMGATTVSSVLSSYLCWMAFFTEAFQLKDEALAD
ncbi:hypothetical protein ACP4OV_016552 [Aristida adscensionis]